MNTIELFSHKFHPQIDAQDMVNFVNDVFVPETQDNEEIVYVTNVFIIQSRFLHNPQSNNALMCLVEIEFEYQDSTGYKSGRKKWLNYRALTHACENRSITRI